MSSDADPRHERETIIAYDETPDDATIYTTNSALMRRLEGHGIEAHRVHRDQGGKEYAREYRVPKRWVKISPPRKVSEAQRESARQEMLALKTASDSQIPGSVPRFAGVSGPGGTETGGDDPDPY